MTAALDRSFYSVFSTDLPRSKAWYLSLLNYEIAFDSDWFVHLRSVDNPALELGIIRRDHDIVPAAFRANPAGGMVTMVVDDVDALHQRAVELGYPVIEEPRDLFYGQRRMLLTDPDGLLLDISSDGEPDPAWLATLT